LWCTQNKTDIEFSEAQRRDGMLIKLLRLFNLDLWRRL
jgi:hypothetical protein